MVPDIGYFTSNSAQLLFYCDFPTELKINADIYFVVTWAITSGIEWTDQLHESKPTRYFSREDFRIKTRLTESQLVQRGFGHLGIRVGIT